MGLAEQSRPPGAVSMLRWIFGIAIAAMCALAFVWPFAVSADPAHPAFKLISIATLLVFFASLIVLLAGRVRRSSAR